MYNVVLTKAAAKDVQELKAAHLSDTAKLLIEVIQSNPFQNPPPYEKLVGNLQGLYSRRINIKHRLVYEVIEDKKIVKVISMWSHYERV
ncbi:MAG: Txe/YoeB family addiction module toxin [Ruminococcus sp.]|nr:Txe/YoeB family addiction module toxin [Ruminococcus sp.]MCD7772498.1 Txe/YoeB family addiction module toxin [Ruminococcus sp.]